MYAIVFQIPALSVFSHSFSRTIRVCCAHARSAPLFYVVPVCPFFSAEPNSFPIWRRAVSCAAGLTSQPIPTSAVRQDTVERARADAIPLRPTPNEARLDVPSIAPLGTEKSVAQAMGLIGV